jgi:hypothetical protein
LLVQFSQLGEDVLEQVKKSLESYSIEDLETKLFQMSESEPRVEEQPEEPIVETPEQFALTGNQLRHEIRNSLSKEKYMDKWDYESRSYWFVDHDESRIIAEDAQENRLVALDYALNGDFVEINFESKRPIKISYVDMEGESQVGFTLTSVERKEFELEQNKSLVTKEIEDKFAEDKKVIEDTKGELTSLREFKAQKDKKDKMAVIEKFSELPEDAIKPFMDNIDQYSKEDLELNLLAEVGKRNLTFSKKDKRKGSESIVSLTSFETTKTDAPSWFALVEEYKNNKN